MSVLPLVASGATVGLGLWLIVGALVRPKITLVQALAALHEPQHPAGRPGEAVGVAARRLLASVGHDPGRHASDLRVTERSAERHALTQVLSAAAGVVTPIVFLSVLAVVGLSVTPLIGFVALTVGSVIGVVQPAARLREQAGVRRRDARRALASYLDLVRVLVAGGSDPRAALVAAAQLGHGWLFTELRGTLSAATTLRRPLWSALEDLGRDLGLTDLSELATTMQLVGSEGTDPVPALTAKAASLRAYELASTRAEMASASEQMTVPAVLIGFAFTVFVVYPALSSLLAASPTHR